MKYYYLEVSRGIEQGKLFALAEGAVSIGRSAQNAIAMHPGEKSVSGHHAIVYRTGDTFLIQDLQSTNGTYVNDIRITESPVLVDDTVGMGKTGPRLTLRGSDQELTSPESADATPQPNEVIAPRTLNDITDRTQRRPFSLGSDLSVASVPPPLPRRQTPDFDDPFVQGSATMEMERKLVDRNIDGSEMRELLRDNKRLDKIIDRGNLSQTQASILRASSDAHKASRKSWVLILAIVVIVATGLTGFFALRAWQYSRILKKGLAIEGSLDNLEKRIALAQDNPEGNEAQLKKLVAQLEQRNLELSSVKERLDNDDVGKFYGDPVEKKIDAVLQRFGERDYHIPPQMIDRVKFHIDVYSGRMKGTVARYMARKEKYFPTITQVFREKRLPPDLAYVSMLESGYNPLALSSAGARGLWQFMVATGQRYGLRVDGQVDERTDPEKATYAAAEYFKDLISMFGGGGSVMLAMAAYNAGEGRVMGALRKIDDPMRNRDFWYIYRMGYLAEETNEYIPRVIALAIICENPEAYGFTRAVETAALQSGDSSGDNGLVEAENLRPLGAESSGR